MLAIGEYGLLFFYSLIIICSGKIKFFFNLFKSYKKILVLSLTAILISINWAGFIFAISINRLQDASMGYYITPMISIGLGFLFLKESISPLKFISILMMFSSLIFLFISLKTVPFIAILIAITWGVYGLLRKTN